MHIDPVAAVLVLAALMALVAGLSDRELLTRIAGGDAKGLRALYDACAPRALSIALRLLRDRNDAEDVVQETFVEVWRRARDFDPARGALQAWVATIARTRAIDRLRSARTAGRTVEAASAEPAPLNPVTLPLEAAEQRQDRERVAAALSSLPAEQRASLELAYFEGLTQSEIAQRTGEPLGTVKTRVRLGLRRLSELLADGGAPR